MNSIMKDTIFMSNKKYKEYKLEYDKYISNYTIEGDVLTVTRNDGTSYTTSVNQEETILAQMKNQWKNVKTVIPSSMFAFGAMGVSQIIFCISALVQKNYFLAITFAILTAAMLSINDRYISTQISKKTEMLKKIEIREQELAAKKQNQRKAKELESNKQNQNDRAFTYETVSNSKNTEQQPEIKAISAEDIIEALKNKGLLNDVLSDSNTLNAVLGDPEVQRIINNLQSYAGSAEEKEEQYNPVTAAISRISRNDVSGNTDNNTYKKAKNLG